MMPRGRGREAPRSESVEGKTPSESISPNLLEIKITEVVDLTTFWAQIGTEIQLSEFEQYCISLSAQCEDKKDSTEDGPITVGHIVAVKDSASPAIWHRAQVTRILPARTVEVHFVDTGKSGRVSLSDLCTQVPELALQISPQALQCNLEGVTMIDDNDIVREMTMARLTEIASQPLKTIVHNASGEVLFLSVYAYHGGHWVSVGEILRLETLVKYSPPGLVVVDDLVNSSSSPRIAVSPDVESDSSTVVNDEELSSPQQLADSKPQPHSSTEVPVCFDLVALSGGEESDPLTPLSKDELSVSQTSQSVGTAPLLPDSAVPLTTSSTDPHFYSSVNLPPLVTSAKLKSFRLALPKLVLSQPSTKSVLEKTVIEGPSLDSVSDNNDNEISTSNNLDSSSVDAEGVGVNNLVKSDSPKATVSIAESSSVVSVQNSKSCREMSAPFIATPADEPSVSCFLQNKQCVPSEQFDPVISPTSPKEDSFIPRNQDGPHDTDSPPPEQVGVDKTSVDSPSRQDDSRKISTDSSPRLDDLHKASAKSSPGQDGLHETATDSPPRQDGPHKSSTDSPLKPETSTASKQDDTHATSTVPRENSLHKTINDLPPKQDSPHKSSKTGIVDSSEDDSSDEDWDDSLLPPRRSQSRSDSGTPINSPEKRFPKETDYENSRQSNVRAKFEAVFGSSENMDYQLKKSKWTGGKKKPNNSRLWQPNYNPQRTSGSFDFNSRNNTFAHHFRGAGRGARPRNSFLYQDPGYQSDIAGSGRSWHSNTGCDPRADLSAQFERKEESSFTAATVEFASPRSMERVGGGINLENTVQRARLSHEAMTSEYKWHVWKMQNSVEKLICNLTGENINDFGQHLNEILNGPSAKTLVALQYKEPPLKILLDSVLSRVSLGKAELLAEGITGAIAEIQDPRLYELLKDAFCTVGRQVYLSSVDTVVKKHDYCLFAQKLFIAAGLSKIEKYSKCVEQGILSCLKTWIGSFTQKGFSLQEQLSCIECFVSLCERVGPALSSSSNSLEECFKGPVKECILSNDCPRDVKEQLLELSLKRVGEWSKTKPSTAQPSGVPANQSSSEPTSNYFSEPVQASSPVPVIFRRGSTGPTTPPLPAQHDGNQYRPSTSTYSVPSDVQRPPHASQQSVLSQALPTALQSPSVRYPASVYEPELRQQSIMAPLRLEPSQVPLSTFYGYSTQKDTLSSGGNDPYKQTLDMLECLGFQELLPTFKQHMLRDFLFFDMANNLPMIRECLSSAQLPIGAVVGIMAYLENKRKAPPQSLYSTPQFSRAATLLPQQQISPDQHSLYYSPAGSQQPRHSSANIGATPTNISANVPTQSANVMLPSPGQHAMSASNQMTVGQPTSWHSPASGSLHGNAGTPGGRFQMYRCILCQSDDHASLECKYRERLYVH